MSAFTFWAYPALAGLAMFGAGLLVGGLWFYGLGVRRGHDDFAAFDADHDGRPGGSLPRSKRPY